jgi:hypothetical protein
MMRPRLKTDGAAIRAIVMVGLFAALMLPDAWAIRVSVATNLLWLWEL